MRSGYATDRLKFRFSHLLAFSPITIKINKSFHTGHVYVDLVVHLYLRVLPVLNSPEVVDIGINTI